ncbi:670_t:CDS:2, partial [Gigaspora margarita]
KARQYKNYDSNSEDTPIIDNNEYDLEDEKKQRELPLRKKGLGPRLHISELLTEKIRRLKNELGEMRVIIQLGPKHDE